MQSKAETNLIVISLLPIEILTKSVFRSINLISIIHI